jgi:hypothetical protein
MPTLGLKPSIRVSQSHAFRMCIILTVSTANSGTQHCRACGKSMTDKWEKVVKVVKRLIKDQVQGEYGARFSTEIHALGYHWVSRLCSA